MKITEDKRKVMKALRKKKMTLRIARIKLSSETILWLEDMPMGEMPVEGMLMEITIAEIQRQIMQMMMKR